MTEAHLVPRLLTLPLSPHELRLALLYADGQSPKEVAVATHVSLVGVESALHHVKVKYRNAGHDVHTKADVRERLIADGLLVIPAPTYQELIAEGLFTAAQAHNERAKPSPSTPVMDPVSTTFSRLDTKSRSPRR